jgi:hypothetical protein
MWAKGIHDEVKTSSELSRALSPLEPMAESAREFLRERIIQGTGTEASRRRKALDWVEALRDNPQARIEWSLRPRMLDELHWCDLRAGALFFAARDAAISVLDQIELHIGNASDQLMSMDATLPESLADKVKALREHAQTFLDESHDRSPAAEATVFCRECIEQNTARLLERLLLREGHVLRLRGRDIVPGVAFRGIVLSESGTARSSEEEGAEAEVSQVIPLPEGISHRVRNFFLLNLDLRSELGTWLSSGLN